MLSERKHFKENENLSAMSGITEAKSTMIAANSSQLIGNTPMLWLSAKTNTTKAKIALKMELENPMASVKDRLALSIAKPQRESVCSAPKAWCPIPFRSPPMAIWTPFTAPTLELTRSSLPSSMDGRAARRDPSLQNAPTTSSPSSKTTYNNYPKGRR